MWPGGSAQAATRRPPWAPPPLHQTSDVLLSLLGRQAPSVKWGGSGGDGHNLRCPPALVYEPDSSAPHNFSPVEFGCWGPVPAGMLWYLLPKHI